MNLSFITPHSAKPSGGGNPSHSAEPRREPFPLSSHAKKRRKKRRKKKEKSRKKRRKRKKKTAKRKKEGKREEKGGKMRKNDVGTLSFEHVVGL